ncbi:MAG: IS66 family insertion sequence element accessory protein TnpA [Planctomycetota bacterium]|jgi:diguanylate cyclase (GGDEF)-like protein
MVADGQRSEDRRDAGGTRRVTLESRRGDPAKRYTAAEKLALLEAFEQSGLGQREFGAQHGVSTASLCRWRREYRAHGEKGLEPKAPKKRKGKTRKPYSPAQRRQAVEAFLASGLGYKPFAATWGVNPKTLRVWLERYREEGPAGLEHPRRAKKPKPKAHPALRTAITQWKRRFPHYGLRRIRDSLYRFCGLKASVPQIRQTLKDEDLMTKPVVRKKRRPPAPRRFERSRPRAARPLRTISLGSGMSIWVDISPPDRLSNLEGPDLRPLRTIQTHTLRPVMRALELLYVGKAESEELASVQEHGVTVSELASVFECIVRLKRTSAGTVVIELSALGSNPGEAMALLREAADGRPVLVAMTTEQWELERPRGNFEHDEILLRPCYPDELWERILRTALPAPERAAARLRGDEARLQALYSDAQRLNRFTNDLDTLSDQIVEIVRARLGANRVSLFLKTNEEGRLRVAEASGVDRTVKEEAVLELGSGVAGKLAERREVVHVKKAGRDGPASGRDYANDSYLIAPLVQGPDVIGVICVTERYEREPFSPGDVAYMEAFAAAAAQVVQNALQFRAAEELTLVDELTGLYNRRYFERNLQMEVQRAKRYGHDVTVAMLDIDHFKAYNDCEGHQAGDGALKEVAKILQQSFRRTDSVCRWGGEEFAVIMPETTREEGNGVEFVDRARRTVEEASLKFRDTQDRQRILTISGGVATLPLQATTWGELVKKADVALYQAKESGRNRIVGY